MNFVGHENVSALGAVMALLYSTYIVLNAVLSTLLGRVIDQDFIANRNIFKSLEQIAGLVFSFFDFLCQTDDGLYDSIHFTVGSVIILAATLIPIGAFAINPSTLGGVNLGNQFTVPDSDTDSYDGQKIQDEEEKQAAENAANEKKVVA